MKIFARRVGILVNLRDLVRDHSTFPRRVFLMHCLKRHDFSCYWTSAAACQQHDDLVRREEGKKEQQQERNYDDTKYFKKLSKTVNPYWVSNAESIYEQLDWNRLVDPRRRKELEEAFRRRYAEVNLEKICKLWSEREKCQDKGRIKAITEELVREAVWIPNETHLEASAIEDEIPKEIFRYGKPRSGDNIVEFSKFCNKFGYLRDDQLGNITFHRSYYLKEHLAELEDGLVRYSLNSLFLKKFQIISVPDMIYPHIIESCGMKTRGERDQVFWLQSQTSDEDVCLSGTAEMSIGGSLQNQIFEEHQLPLKFTAVSRCFRAETSSLEEERGLYLVHEFTKVEMFGVTANETGNESDVLHQEFRQIEEDNFAALNLHFTTLEMPPSELGSSAFRKFDIEAWMPGRKMFGEISSCSNCTDFQSRRLNIRYRPRNSRSDTDLKYVHTVNGTACAIPRLLIALVETCQEQNGVVKLPSALSSFMPRNWEESMKDFPNHKVLFLRNKSTQDKYIHNVH